MKNLLGLLLLVAFTFASCGDDDCFTEDWIGSYDLTSDAVCEDDATITADTTFQISAGSTAGTLSSSGLEFTVNEETCTASTSIITIERDGDRLTSTIGNCSFEYEKR